MTKEELRKIVEDIEMHGLLQFRKYDEYLISNLIENKITFGSAQNFNDPFDCNLSIDVDSSFSEYIDMVKLSPYVHGQSEEWIKQRARYLYENQNIFKNDIRGLILGHRRFTCFNIPEKKPHLKNSLFWANYANKHRGICMKFSGSILTHYIENSNWIIQFIPIEYCKDNNIPAFNYIQYKLYEKDINGYKASQYFYGTKSKEWAYEYEVRFIYYDAKKIDSQYINFEFPTEVLEQIYLGTKITEDEKNVILKCLSDKKYDHVDIYKLEMDDKRFKLNDILIRKGNK